MNIEQFRTYCLALPFTKKKTPFAGFFPNARDILAFYVGTKIFCSLDLDKFDKRSLKCAPERIVELKERYQAADNPFNMSPKYWLSIRFNDDLPDALLMTSSAASSWLSIRFNDDLPDALLLDLVQHSYALVLANLPRKQREQLG